MRLRIIRLMVKDAMKHWLIGFSLGLCMYTISALFNPLTTLEGAEVPFIDAILKVVLPLAVFNGVFTSVVVGVTWIVVGHYRKELEKELGGETANYAIISRPSSR